MENPYKQSVGTTVKYLGDVANHPGLGTITNVLTNKWGTNYEITLTDEGEDPRVLWITDSAFEGIGARFILSPERAA